MPVTIINKQQTSPEIWALNLLPPHEITSKNPAPCSSSLWPEFDRNQMKTAPLVRLIEATQMYQPVAGSSDSSRYFVVAGNQRLKVAARYHNKRLSCRLEGEDLNKNYTQKDLGAFNIKSDNHASFHAEINDLKLAAKTLGAVLMDLNLSFETPIPNFDIIRAAS